MIEIETLIPEPVPLNTAGGVLRVYPLRARQFGAMMRALAPVLYTLHPDTRELDLPALLACEDEVRRIVAVGLDLTEQFAGALSRDERHAALLLILALNEEFFFPEGPGGEDGKTFRPEPEALADTLQRLIESGHRWPDIQDYTLAQIRAFGAAAGRLERERDKTALLSARAAAADGQSFNRWLHALSGEAQHGE